MGPRYVTTVTTWHATDGDGDMNIYTRTIAWQYVMPIVKHTLALWVVEQYDEAPGNITTGDIREHLVLAFDTGPTDFSLMPSWIIGVLFVHDVQLQRRREYKRCVLGRSEFGRLYWEAVRRSLLATIPNEDNRHD